MMVSAKSVMHKAFKGAQALSEVVRLYMRRPQSDQAHLDATLEWLTRAQDVCEGKGVSTLYDSASGWSPDPYPETSGYIIATFLKYADSTGDAKFVDRALALGEWEIAIQRKDGAVLSSVRGDEVRVFNTGQVILGWCCLFERTHEARFLQAAVQAGQYLISIQESDGSWIRDTYCGARTYHARVAWSLIRLAKLSDEKIFLTSAVQNIHWVLAQQNEAGWFRNCGFHVAPPITHVIAYTLEGLLESYILCAHAREHELALHIREAVLRAGLAIARCCRRYSMYGFRGLIPAAFDSSWQPAARYSCLTGNAQIAICLMRLGHITQSMDYVQAASYLIDGLKRTQDLDSQIIGVQGGLAGSFPFFAGYVPGAYPNWAAKFMADALMMRLHYDEQWRIEA